MNGRTEKSARFARNLKAYAQKRRVTPKQIENLRNATRQDVRSWMQGTGMPTTEQLVMLAVIFGTTVDELVGDNSKRKNDVR